MTAEQGPPTDGAAGGSAPGDAQQDREDRYAAWAKRLRDDKRTLVASFHPEDPSETDEATHPWSRESRAAADAAPPEDRSADHEPAFDMGLLMRSSSNESPGGSDGNSSAADEQSAPPEP